VGVSPAVPLVIWLFIGAVFVGVPAVVIGIALLLRALRSRSVLRAGSLAPAAAPAGTAGTAGLTATVISAAREHARRTARCGLAGLVVGVVLGIATVLSNRGGFAVLTCGGGYLCGLLVGEYTAQPRSRGEQRSAVLRARRPADYVPRWAAAMIVVVGTLIIAAVIAFSVERPIHYGAWHPFPGQSFSLPGGSTSWPSLPVMLAGVAFAAVVVLVGAAGLRRVAGRPQLTDDAGQAADEWLRRQSGRAITGALLSLLLLLLAAFLIGGAAGLAVPVPVISPGAYIANRIMVNAGLVSACGSIASWLVLSGWIRRPRPAAGPAATPTLRSQS
jgi:hypothetical protein